MATVFILNPLFGNPAIRSKYNGDRTLTHTLTGPLVPFRPKVVLLRTQGRTEVASCVAGPAGEIEFDGIAPGDYEIIVYGEGRYRSEVFGPVSIT